MERTVIFRDAQDLDAGDFNRLQSMAQTSMDHLVADGITPNRKFAGFAAAATGSTQLTVQAGRLYSGGKIFNRADELQIDLTTSIPLATKKIVSLVVFGTEIDTGAVPREFLLNEETGASEPRVVPMERARIANVNIVAGVESADPVPPAVDAGALVLANIVLGPAGIVSVTEYAANKIDSVNTVSTRVDVVEQFVEDARPKMVALGSDLAALKTAVAGTVDQTGYARVLTRLAVIEAKSGIPSAATSSAADFYLDLSASDGAFAGYAARIDEGVRFPTIAAADAALNIYNALNPAAKIIGGMMFPAFRRELRLRSGARSGEIQVSAYSYQEHELVERTVSRQRLRYGHTYWDSASALYWNTSAYDYWWYTYAYYGEVFPGLAALNGYLYGRYPYFWYDTVEEHYWDKVTIDHTIPGMQIAETFLNANGGWLEAIGLTFTRLANAGAATVMVCETIRGTPDLDKVISVTTLDRASMVLNAETLVPIQPVWLDGGKRYALVIITAADHWLATTAGENFPQGTLFYVLDGAYQMGDATKDLCFSLHFAKFTASRAVIDLQSVQLAGGISEIDILAGAVVPGSTELTYEVQVNNAWVPIAKTDGPPAINAGGVLPPLLPLRAVFTGTPDAMPGLKLTGSRIRVARPATAFKHITKVRTLPASSTQIRVIQRLERFDAAHHTATAKLLTGGAYTTVNNASSFVDAAVDNGAAIERTWLFNLGAGVTQYRIQTEGTTDSALNLFHIASRKDYAL